MRAQQHLHAVQVSQFGMGNGLQPFGTQTLDLVGIVDDVSQAIQGTLRVQFLFGLAYGRHHAEAETGVRVYFDIGCHS